MTMHRWLLAISMACLSSHAAGQSILDKAGRDDVVRIPQQDQAMAAAMKTARAGLQAFLAIAANPRPGLERFSVKIGLPWQGGHEYVWIRPFEHEGDNFVGHLTNTPRNVSNLKYGSRLKFTRKDIVDWSYFDGDEMVGNFTACALLKNDTREQREAFKRQYGLDCR